jgi:ribosomal protein S25
MTALAFGNRCGHDPDNPRQFMPPESHGKRPPVIALLQKKLLNYYSRPIAIPSLNAANGSDKQQRSERREACTALLSVLLHYLDIKTMRVGVPTDNGSFAGLTMSLLAERAGIELRRAERAMRDLKAAGLVNVFPICEKLGECSYKGYAAIRTISDKLFTIFGLKKELKRNRDKASKKAKKIEKKRDEAELAKIALMMQAEQYQPTLTDKEKRRERAGEAKHISSMLRA